MPHPGLFGRAFGALFSKSLSQVAWALVKHRLLGQRIIPGSGDVEFSIFAFHWVRSRESLAALMDSVRISVGNVQFPVVRSISACVFAR